MSPPVHPEKGDEVRRFEPSVFISSSSLPRPPTLRLEPAMKRSYNASSPSAPYQQGYPQPAAPAPPLPPGPPPPAPAPNPYANYGYGGPPQQAQQVTQQQQQQQYPGYAYPQVRARFFVHPLVHPTSLES